jgi:diguanylate cyclase (GGDEF)-like protein
LFRFGIRQKVMLVLLTVVLVALTVSAWMAFKEEERIILKQVKQRGNDISRFVAKSLSFSVVGYDYHTIQLLLNEVTLSEEINYARVINARGKVMGASGKIGDKNEQVIFKQQIRLNQTALGYLELGFSTHKTINQLKQQKYNLLKREALIILLIAIGEFLALSIIIIRPVSVMSKSLDNGIDEKGRIVAKIPINTNDEFGRLANLFNVLGEQLNDANTQLQSKIDLADKKLVESNRQLLEQAEELKKMSAEFRRMSITDPLTGLYNRRFFEDMLEAEMKLTDRYGDINSLLVIDIDYFKKVNDEFGHPGGDIVLKEVAHLFKDNVRSNDVLCRVGGEEFVVFCRRVDKDDSMMIAEKIRSNIEKSAIGINDKTLHITVSIGVSTCRKSDIAPGSMYLYRKADIAVYHSKEHGRNRVTHYDDIEFEVHNTARQAVDVDGD